MGYGEYLKDMLKPMGVYSLNSGYSAAELDAVGAAMDGAAECADNLKTEGIPQTARGSGLAAWENLFPILVFGETENERRSAVARLISVDDASCTQKALEGQLASCGIPGKITVTDEKFKVKLHFTSGRGEPDEKMINAALSILPAHICTEFTRDCLTWDRAEELFPTWDEFDACECSAAQLSALE